MMDQNFSRLMDKNKVESDLPLGKDEAEHFANEPEEINFAIQ